LGYECENFFKECAITHSAKAIEKIERKVNEKLEPTRKQLLSDLFLYASDGTPSIIAAVRADGMGESFPFAVGTNHRVFRFFRVVRPAGILSRIGRSVTWYSHG